MRNHKAQAKLANIARFSAVYEAKKGLHGASPPPLCKIITPFLSY